MWRRDAGVTEALYMTKIASKVILTISNQRKEKIETEVPHIFAAGDVRSGSPRQVVTAVGDRATAAISAQTLLQRLSLD